MKVLILTCNTGQGHNSSATSIKEYFVANGHVCDTADALSFLSAKASKIICTCFTGIYRHIPQAFNIGYSRSGTKAPAEASLSPNEHIQRVKKTDYMTKAMIFGTRKLRKFIADNDYTHIISVHLFPAVMINFMQKKFPLDIKNFLLATDYTCYPFIEKTNADVYFLPHKDLADEFASRGIPRERTVASGIPVRKAFLTMPTRQQARLELGIPADAKLVFMMCGSMGCGPIKSIAAEIARALPNGARLIVSCGTNKKLLTSLQKLGMDNLIPLGYSNDIPRIMAAADLFITKPGGLSITEAGVAGLPMLLMNVVGGCETPNYNFFANHNYAFIASDSKDIPKICTDILLKPDSLRLCKQNLKSSFLGNAVEIIYNTVVNCQ